MIQMQVLKVQKVVMLEREAWARNFYERTVSNVMTENKSTLLKGTPKRVGKRAHWSKVIAWSFSRCISWNAKSTETEMDGQIRKYKYISSAEGAKILDLSKRQSAQGEHTSCQQPFLKFCHSGMLATPCDPATPRYVRGPAERARDPKWGRDPAFENAGL